LKRSMTSRPESIIPALKPTFAAIFPGRAGLNLDNESGKLTVAFGIPVITSEAPEKAAEQDNISGM